MWDPETVKRIYFFLPFLNFKDISAITISWFMLDKSAIWKVQPYNSNTYFNFP